MSSLRIRKAALLAAGLALAACATGTSTRIVESWKAPDAGPLRFNKVLALAILDNEDIRSLAEDELQADLKGVQAVQGYKFLSVADFGDRERAKEVLQREGFDGVVVLRLAAAKQDVSWTVHDDPLSDNTYGGSFWGGYGMPPELNVGTTVRVEINIYSLPDDKLIWAGVSETFNPQHTQQVVAAIVEAAGKALRRQGLITG
ncbi:MAG TPA: hypothetical protein VF789_22075 [Thermoanaerobaculia bacterium]